MVLAGGARHLATRRKQPLVDRSLRSQRYGFIDCRS